MRDLTELDRFRIVENWVVQHYGSVGDSSSGVFRVKNWAGELLSIIASSGEGWDHVSVSHPRRPPTWGEMEMVKRLFFKEHETAMQLHVPTTDHINIHDNCLHLWRPLDREIPLPPKYMV